MSGQITDKGCGVILTTFSDVCNVERVDADANPCVDAMAEAVKTA